MKPKNSEICDKIKCYSRYFCGESDVAFCPIPVIHSLQKTGKVEVKER